MGCVSRDVGGSVLQQKLPEGGARSVRVGLRAVSVAKLPKGGSKW